MIEANLSRIYNKSWACTPFHLCRPTHLSLQICNGHVHMILLICNFPHVSLYKKRLQKYIEKCPPWSLKRKSEVCPKQSIPVQAWGASCSSPELHCAGSSLDSAFAHSSCEMIRPSWKKPWALFRQKQKLHIKILTSVARVGKNRAQRETGGAWGQLRRRNKKISKQRRKDRSVFNNSSTPEKTLVKCS